MLSKFILGGLVTGLGLYARAATAESSSSDLTEWRGQDLIVWNSRVTPIIFGDDTENYDIQVIEPTAEDVAKIVEAVETFRTAFASGDEGAILSAFLNTTQMGTLTPEDDSNLKWKCSELTDITREHCSICADYVDELKEANFVVSEKYVDEEEPMILDETMIHQEPLAA